MAPAGCCEALTPVHGTSIAGMPGEMEAAAEELLLELELAGGLGTGA
jgi:hypothetical protein